MPKHPANKQDQTGHNREMDTESGKNMLLLFFFSTFQNRTEGAIRHFEQPNFRILNHYLL